MDFEAAMRAAAKEADNAINSIMFDYSLGHLRDEDDISGALVGALRIQMSKRIGGLQWSASIVQHRSGRAAHEKKIGADILIHVSIQTNSEKFSKGVLVQAKKLEPNYKMNNAAHSELVSQCKKMLSVSPGGSYVFDYAKGSMRCGSAARVSGSSRRDLYALCSWTSYRFFLELFRCPIGDHNITSAVYEDLPVPYKIEIGASGDLDDEIIYD